RPARKKETRGSRCACDLDVIASGERLGHDPSWLWISGRAFLLRRAFAGPKNRAPARSTVKLPKICLPPVARRDSRGIRYGSQSRGLRRETVVEPCCNGNLSWDRCGAMSTRSSAALPETVAKGNP